MSNIPLSSVKGPQNQSAGPLSGPSIAKNLNATTEEVKNSPLSSTAAIKQRVEKHSHWDQLGTINDKLMTLKDSQGLLEGIQKDLAKIGWEVAKSDDSTAHVSVLVDHLQEKVDGSGKVDGNLQPLQAPPVSSYLMNRVDLVGAKEHAEVLNVQTPTGHQFQLTYRENQTAEESLRHLEKALMSLDVDVSLSETGQLMLTGDRRVINGAWTLSGQGVRVPAGNPVEISPMRAPEALETLKKHIQGDRREASLGLVKELRVRVEGYKQSVSTELSAVRDEANRMGISNPMPKDQLLDLANTIAESISGGDFNDRIHAMRTQANLSRDMVVSALTR